MYNRILNLPTKSKQSLFLFGPRGTGKTFLIRQKFPQALYFDLLKFSTYHELASQPDRLENLIPPKHTDWIIIFR